MKTKESEKNEAWLKEIENIVFNKIRHCPPSPLPPPKEVPNKSEYILGFKVNSTNDSAIKTKTESKKRNNMSALQLGLTNFRLALTAAEIEPIAIIPKVIWEKISKRCNLFRFENFQNGKQVNARASKLIEYLIKRSLIISALTSAIGYGLNNAFHGIHWAINLLCIILVSGIYAIELIELKYKEFNGYDGLFTFFVCSALIAPLLWIGPVNNVFSIGLLPIMVILLIPIMLKRIGIGAYSPLIKCSLKIIPQRLLIKNLWPDNIDTRTSDRIEVTPLFPEPTQEFKKLLISLEPISYKLCLAAQLSAIVVNRTEVAAEILEFEKYGEKEFARRKGDPIVYIKSKDGEFVAILGQFGKFSKEKKAIRIARSCSL